MVRRPQGAYIGGHTIWPPSHNPDGGWEPTTVVQKRPSKVSASDGIAAEKAQAKALRVRREELRREIGAIEAFRSRIKGTEAYKLARDAYVEACGSADFAGVARPLRPAILVGTLTLPRLRLEVRRLKERWSAAVAELR